jgi:hypothetical protein
VGVLAGIVTLVLQLREDRSDQEHVADCRKKHGVPQTPQQSPYAQGVWADCSWPPADGARADGLGQIELRRVDNGLQSGGGYEGADIMDTECAQVLLQYRHDQQGHQMVSKAAVIDVGQVLGVVMTGGRLRLEPVTTPKFVKLDVEEVASGKLVVVVPVAVGVQRLECA